MDEPDPAHAETPDQGKACPVFFKPARRFGAKIVPSGHHMGWVSVRAQPKLGFGNFARSNGKHIEAIGYGVFRVHLGASSLQQHPTQLLTIPTIVYYASNQPSLN